MKISELPDLLRQQFPTATVPATAGELAVGSFPEWDSLGNFNFLLLVEEQYEIRFSMDEMSELKSLAGIGAALRKKGIEP